MKKNLLAFFFGCVVVVGLFAAIEIYYRLFVPPKPPSFSFDPIAYVHSPEAVLSGELLEQIYKDPIMSWRNLRPIQGAENFFLDGFDGSEKGVLGCCVLKALFANPGSFRSRVYSSRRELLYDAQFTFDDHGRRITPAVSQPRKAILALGDSYTLGEGVNDEQSFPYVLGTYRPSTQVYNLGMSGGSPNETLYEITRLPKRRLPDLIGQEVTVLYTFMNDHMERLICRSNCLTALGSWRLGQPFYTLKDGRPHFEGSFHDRTGLNNFYSWFNKSAFVQGSGIILPPRFTEKHFDFFATMMVEIRDNLKVKYPSLNFYVVMYPGNSFPYAYDVASACRKRGLNVLSYANLDMEGLTQNRAYIAGDGHPSPISHMIFARLLDRDLPR